MRDVLRPSLARHLLLLALTATLTLPAVAEPPDACRTKDPSGQRPNHSADEEHCERPEPEAKSTKQAEADKPTPEALALEALHDKLDGIAHRQETNRQDLQGRLDDVEDKVDHHTHETPGKKRGGKIRGPGEIRVGNPEIVTRERLVNDRLEQERWLYKQLEKSDTATFGFEGKSDLRSFLGFSARVGVETDDNILDLYDTQSAANIADIQRKQEQDALQNRIDTLNKLKTIRDLEKELEGNGTSSGGIVAANETETTPDGSGDDSGGGNDSGGDGGGDATPTPARTGTDSTLGFQERLLKAGRSDLIPDKESPQETAAQASPIDTFRDRLAYREEIRNEIFENALDDRHDLTGNTAYRINIDSTILPRRKQDAWAVIEVEVQNDKKGIGDWKQHLDAWKIDLEREINSLMLTRLQSAIPCYGLEDVSIDRNGETTVRRSLQSGCLPEDLERQVFDHFQDAILQSQPILALAEKVDWEIVEAMKTESSQSNWPEKSTLKRAEFRNLLAKSHLASLIELAPNKDGCHLREDCSPAKRERDLMALNLLAAVETIRTLFADIDTRLGALAYLMATYHQGLFSSTEGLRDFVTIKGPDPGQNPHLNVSFCEAICTGQDKPTAHVCPTRGPKTAEASKGHRCKIKRHLDDLERVYAFAATPKESVQRISEVTNRRNSLELSALLSTRNGKGAAEAILESQRILNGISRRPLVVGYTQAVDHSGERSDSATAGWVIGPKFKLTEATWTWPWNKGFRYEHMPIQNNLSFSISVPEWWTSATLIIRRHWRSTKGKIIATEPEIEHRIELPGTYAGITRALVRYRLPQVLRQGRWDVVQGKSASLLIRGAELWRSSRVTLGGQIANEIEVLPNMHGIVAKFEKVTESASVDGKSKRENIPVRVWTSEGSQQAGTVTVHPGTPEKPKTLAIAADPPRMIKGKELVLKVTQGAIPDKRQSLAAQLYVLKGDAFEAPIYFAEKEIDYNAAQKAITVTLTDAKLNGVTEPRQVRAQLIVNEKPGGAPKTTNATHLVPLYPTAPKITFKVTKNGKASTELSGDVDIELKTPRFMASAFPPFGRDSRIEFKAGTETLTLDVKTWTLTDTAFVLKGSFTDVSGFKSGTKVNVEPKMIDSALAGIEFNPSKIELMKP